MEVIKPIGEHNYEKETAHHICESLQINVCLDGKEEINTIELTADICKIYTII